MSTSTSEILEHTLTVIPKSFPAIPFTTLLLPIEKPNPTIAAFAISASFASFIYVRAKTAERNSPDDATPHIAEVSFILNTVTPIVAAIAFQNPEYTAPILISLGFINLALISEALYQADKDLAGSNEN